MCFEHICKEKDKVRYIDCVRQQRQTKSSYVCRQWITWL